MAAIIRVQMATNAARPSPIVPVIPAIPRASAIVAAQAPAAAISRNATSRLGRPGRRRASPGEPGPGGPLTRPRRTARKSRPAPRAPSRCRTSTGARRGPARPSGSCSTGGARWPAEPGRGLEGDEVLDAKVDAVADPDMVAAAIIAVADGHLLHAEQFADQRGEHRQRPAELPGHHRPE